MKKKMNIKELNFEVEKLEKKLEETRKNMDSNLKKIYLAKKEGGKGFKSRCVVQRIF